MPLILCTEQPLSEISTRRKCGRSSTYAAAMSGKSCLAKFTSVHPHV